MQRMYQSACCFGRKLTTHRQATAVDLTWERRLGRCNPGTKSQTQGEVAPIQLALSSFFRGSYDLVAGSKVGGPGGNRRSRGGVGRFLPQFASGLPPEYLSGRRLCLGFDSSAPGLASWHNEDAGHLRCSDFQQA